MAVDEQPFTELKTLHVIIRLLALFDQHAVQPEVSFRLCRILGVNQIPDGRNRLLFILLVEQLSVKQIAVVLIAFLNLVSYFVQLVWLANVTK